MPINYAKVKPQVEKMGRMYGHKAQEQSERMRAAYHQFEEIASNADVFKRVQLARERDAGYRGAAPLDPEPINSIHLLPPAPPRATILAVDGSQVYPDIHSAAFYYLTNVAVFTYYHGEVRLPLEFSEPLLHYSDSFLRDEYDQLVTNATVNARRTVREMETLAEFVWEQRATPVPILALYDGRLLFWLGQDVPDHNQLAADYRGGIVRIHDTHDWMNQHHQHNANLVGYVDRPTSRFVVAMLELLALPEQQVTRTELKRSSTYEGVDDRWLFQRLLNAGERSALMVQQSPQNKFYRQQGESYEIVFFYVNVGRAGAPHLARVELPMWVARNPQAVNEIHALLVAQSRITGNYPYALTRADELAVVRNFDRNTLDNLIQTELIRNQQTPEESGKLMGKHQTRSVRQGFGFGQPRSHGRE